MNPNAMLSLLQVHTKWHLHIILTATYSYQHITFAIYLIMLPWLIKHCKKMCIYELNKGYTSKQTQHLESSKRHVTRLRKSFDNLATYQALVALLLKDCQSAIFTLSFRNKAHSKLRLSSSLIVKFVQCPYEEKQGRLKTQSPRKRNQIPDFRNTGKPIDISCKMSYMEISI